MNLHKAVKASLKLMISNGIILASFFHFQLYGYVLYCMPLADVTRDTMYSPWCDKLIPLPYSYIQDSYWNVGFLCYFELKQIPNFLLATPMILQNSYAVVYWRIVVIKKILKLWGHLVSCIENQSLIIWQCMCQESFWKQTNLWSIYMKCKHVLSFFIYLCKLCWK